MSNALNRAVATAIRKIPPEILALVFSQQYHQWGHHSNSIEYEIMQKVIRSRVLPDLDFVGGIEDFIRLEGNGVTMERTDERYTVIYVPKEATGGKTITSALYLSYYDFRNSYGEGGTMGFKECSVNGLTAAAMALSNSFDQPKGIPGTGRLEIVGENAILVKDQIIVPSNGVLRCILSNDPDLNNLSVRSYVVFSELCSLAIKSYIWTNSVVKIDEGVAMAGKNIGAYRQVIDSYADAEDMYIEFLTKRWAKTAKMNDRATHLNIIRSQISSFI